MHEMQTIAIDVLIAWASVSPSVCPSAASLCRHSRKLVRNAVLIKIMYLK